MSVTDATILDPSIDRRLARDIDAAESDQLLAYQDSLGNWTIGRGHLLPRPGTPAGWKGFTIIQSTSDRYFNGDLLDAIALASAWPEFASCDTDCRKNALRELAFNMAHRFEMWAPTIKLIEAKDWQGVHDHLLGSRWAKQVQPHGFDTPGRATRIANYFLTGEYPCQSGT